MKKRFIRHNFNMVEIMLAVIVIALGITGTFVLFPVGVNANKSAVADNSIADIAEYVTGFVRAKLLAAARPPDGEDEEKNDADTHKNDKSKSFKSKIVKKYFDDIESASDAYKEAIEVGSPSGWTELNNGNSVATILKHSDRGIYLVRQLSGPEDNRFVDFAAVARVYLDRKDEDSTGLEDAFFPAMDEEKKRTKVVDDKVEFDKPADDDIDVLQSCFLPAVLELSWPATVPIEEREKRYFRFEIFNDYYRL